MTLDGAPPVAPERGPFVALTTVSRGYLETMRIPLRRGRALVDGDFRDGLPGLALGATPGRVRRMVIGNSAVSIGAGCVLRFLVAVGLAQALSLSVQEVDARNPISCCIVLLAVVLVVLISSYAPARRVSRVETVVAAR